MRILAAGIALGACLVSLSPVHAQEKLAKSRIISVGLFKNGLAIVRHEVDVPEAGTYRLDKVPDAVHGTFWIESDAEIEAAVQMREVEVPAHRAGHLSLQDELAGRKVVIHLKGDRVPPISGTVLKLEPAPEDPPALSGRFVVLRTPKGRSYVDATEIASVEVEGDNDTVKQKKAFLVLTVGQTEKRPVVHMSYLTTGISWAPSYRLDISDPKTMKLAQTTVVRNELTGLDGAEVWLISGFPSVAFQHVMTPLSPKTSWEAFFQQVGRPPSFDGTANGALTNQAVANFRVAPGAAIDLSATPTGEGVDLHYQSIGKRTLAKGDALSLTVATGKASYERIVEWLIPDNRDENGRYLTDRRHTWVRAVSEDEDEQPWDALRFKNPFAFPMTTAPATVVANGKFNGQRTSYFVNAGEQNVVRITRALSIRTRSTEQEKQDKNTSHREIVYVGGREYRKATVQAEVAVSNHRKEEVKLVIRRRFSGEMSSAEGAPNVVLREEGIWSANRRYEVVWTVTLRPGEDKRLNYAYSVLVLN